ncbi:MAG: cytochrome P450 [Solirubrobacterales bacterium]|nr:cytochrome P450 [Solirubrobacterales bacterium]MBV9366475.1 cytochrome P450 [Solirubrobacterales bacterium]MBV9680260.1 cytochrome P450 [Solirubrobacterales bacterium]MBV9808454.1 cytochrome P450 [Solirubrobacterales bacterium]
MAVKANGNGVARGLRWAENFVLSHPQLSRRSLGLLRFACPVARIGDTAIVTRYSDVVEVLSRDNDFTIGLYSPKMEAIAGRFILGLQQSPEYEHDVSVLRIAVPQSDMARIRTVVGEIVQEIFTQVAPLGEIDVVRELSDVVPARLSARYFGAPGPTELQLISWGRAQFRELFYNLRNDPAITAPAMVSSREMQEHVEKLIAARKAERAGGAPQRDDVLGRLVAFEADGSVGIDDGWIKTYIMGLILGMLPLTSKAAALAVNVLLDRPGMLASAHEAAAENHDDLLWRLISEAMRIAPQSPGQYRLSDGVWTLGARRREIPAGTKVFAATQSAMFDRRAFATPSRVRTDRPASRYLHFGYGLHSCFGRFISYEAQIPLMLKALLRQPNLRRAPGPPGRLAWDGPFPNSLTVTFDQS